MYCCLSNTVGALSLGTDTITCTVDLRGVGRAWSDACTVNCKNRWVSVYLDHYIQVCVRECACLYMCMHLCLHSFCIFIYKPGSGTKIKVILCCNQLNSISFVKYTKENFECNFQYSCSITEYVDSLCWSELNELTHRECGDICGGERLLDRHLARCRVHVEILRGRGVSNQTVAHNVLSKKTQVKKATPNVCLCKRVDICCTEPTN